MWFDGELVRYAMDVPPTVWRVSLKRYPPLSLPPYSAQGDGRFDDPSEGEPPETDVYSVLYCATSAYTAFIEAMSGFRSRLGAIRELLSETVLVVDERDALSGLQSSSGVVTRDWRDAVQLTSGTIVTSVPVLDLTDAAAIQTLRAHLAPSLIALGLDDLDFSHVLGGNRDLTRAISRWIWSMESDAGEPLFSGIRYRSRFDPNCICLALYEDRYRIDGDVTVQPITSETPGFAEAASILRLEIG